MWDQMRVNYSARHMESTLVCSERTGVISQLYHFPSGDGPEKRARVTCLHFGLIPLWGEGLLCAFSRWADEIEKGTSLTRQVPRPAAS